MGITLLRDIEKNQRVQCLLNLIKDNKYSVKCLFNCDDFLNEMIIFCKLKNYDINYSNKNQIVWHFAYNKDVPLCYCGNKSKFINVNIGYRNCSYKCSYEQTCLIRYGCKNSYQIQKVKDIISVKNKENIQQIVQKTKQTCLLKYGVDNPAKSTLIKEKQSVIRLKNNSNNLKVNVKKFKNTELTYQGNYEYSFLEYCEMNGILDKIKRGPIIKYFNGERQAIYYPDFYYEELNLIIEIKSTYTYNLHKEINELKKFACINKAYNFIFIIDNNFKNIF